jgi:hypothetical protein
MDRKKRGRPFRIADSYIMFLAVKRYVFSIDFRQLEGFTRSLQKMFPVLTAIDYSWIRSCYRGSLDGLMLSFFDECIHIQHTTCSRTL